MSKYKEAGITRVYEAVAYLLREKGEATNNTVIRHTGLSYATVNWVLKNYYKKWELNQRKAYERKGVPYVYTHPSFEPVTTLFSTELITDAKSLPPSDPDEEYIEAIKRWMKAKEEYEQAKEDFRLATETYLSLAEFPFYVKTER